MAFQADARSARYLQAAAASSEAAAAAVGGLGGGTPWQSKRHCSAGSSSRRSSSMPVGEADIEDAFASKGICGDPNWRPTLSFHQMPRWGPSGRVAPLYDAMDRSWRTVGSSFLAKSQRVHGGASCRGSGYDVGTTTLPEPSEQDLDRWFKPPETGGDGAQEEDEQPESLCWEPELGKLRSYMTNGLARPGMTNPPRNPKVQRDLVAYLQACGVPVVVEPSVASCSTTASSRFTDDGNLSISSVAESSSRRSSSMPTLSRRSTKPSAAASLSTSLVARASTRKAKACPVAELKAMLEVKLPQPISRLPNETELMRKHKDLRSLRNSHGVSFTTLPNDTLALLTMYHSKASRNLPAARTPTGR
eukprot:TRINITY_DN22620_c0_g1_i2.p1 TRINITY_DN22620_c0_g1~~TRINITY_DN22620_c0_g1_i2.p1  ORF type:complete len:362 (+),score=37.24 TRINITY_DN22620_c0_g1_i2:111-1196(+)